MLAACGGQVTTSDGGGDAGAEHDDFDGTVTACSAGAAMLCGAACGNTCPYKQSDGTGCMQPGDNDGSALSLCNTLDGGIIFSTVSCNECLDGHACTVTTSEVPVTATASDLFAQMVCDDVRFAEMFALNGRLDLARYPDRSAYTGDPLPPPPTACPSVPGIQLCGGACGECAAGYVCIGRSPEHPYSLCVNDWTKQIPSFPQPVCIRDAGTIDGGFVGSCYDGNDKFRCLTFKVDDASQPIADQFSLCVDKSICLAAAAGYPGGAFCSP